MFYSSLMFLKNLEIINWKNHGLCLSHYLSALVLSWDAMLNMTKAELELISDADMCLFFEKGMRNGDSYTSKKCSKI